MCLATYMEWGKVWEFFPEILIHVHVNVHDTCYCAIEDKIDHLSLRDVPCNIVQLQSEISCELPKVLVLFEFSLWMQDFMT